jgi:hypothetical protein
MLEGSLLFKKDYQANLPLMTDKSNYWLGNFEAGQPGQNS